MLPNFLFHKPLKQRVQCRYFAKRIKKGLQNRLKKMALMRSPVSVIMADLTRIEKNRIHAPDDDPDPFLLKEVKPGEALPIYEVDGYELPRGIRPDQLRFGFTGDDLEACGVSKEDEDFKLIRQALSFYNANGTEIIRQLKKNEIARWGLHPFDNGNREVAICNITIKMRRLQDQMKANRKNFTALFWYRRMFYERRKQLRELRKLDFGRYKKLMTYLGLRDIFNVALNAPAIHKMAHVYSKKRPVGGRRSSRGPI